MSQYFVNEVESHSMLWLRIYRHVLSLKSTIDSAALSVAIVSTTSGDERLAIGSMGCGLMVAVESADVASSLCAHAVKQVVKAVIMRIIFFISELCCRL